MKNVALEQNNVQAAPLYIIKAEFCIEPQQIQSITALFFNLNDKQITFYIHSIA